MTDSTKFLTDIFKEQRTDGDWLSVVIT